MEPADIDWKRVVSRYVRDEVYENINAPRWADLADTDAAGVGASTVDDVAWFCRPDCQHPRTVEDFQISTPSPKAKLMRCSSEILPLGERNANDCRDGNLKRRGGIAAFLPSTPLRSSPKPKPKPSPKKKYREDAENQDPNLPASGNAGINGGKTVREVVKSSAEKRREDEENKWPRLRSVMSAKNLFAGKDLLAQISEFCQELKNMAMRKDRASASAQAESFRGEEERILVKVKEVEQEEAGGDANNETKRKDESEKKWKKMTLNVGTDEKHKKKGNGNSSLLKEAVRSCPPTPQRFPSPSSNRLKSTKASATTSSPLNKPPKPSASERGILQELGQRRDERSALVPTDEQANISCVSSDAEGRSTDVFWFFKPCTYLVK